MPKTKPERAPISNEPDVPPLEITTPILPAPPQPPGWARGGFDLPPADLPSHIDVASQRRAVAPTRTAPVKQANVPNEPSGAPWSPRTPLPPQGPSNWPPADHGANPMPCTHRRAGSTSALTVGDRDLDTHDLNSAVCRIFFARSAIKTRSRLSARCASPLTASSVTSESNRRERATTQRSFEVERVARMIGAPPTNDRHHDELDRRNR